MYNLFKIQIANMLNIMYVCMYVQTGVRAIPTTLLTACHPK